MKLKSLLFLLILKSLFSFGQKIKILNIEKNIENGGIQYNLFCELNNNTNEKVIIPLPTEFTENINPNSYNFFFDIVTFPKESMKEWEVPPYQMQNVVKLKLNNFVIAEPKQKINFIINTKNIIFYYREFNREINPKYIRIIYEPLDDINKERNLSPELKNLKIHNKKIVSNKFRL